MQGVDILLDRYGQADLLGDGGSGLRLARINQDVERSRSRHSAHRQLHRIASRGRQGSARGRSGIEGARNLGRIVHPHVPDQTVHPGLCGDHVVGHDLVRPFRRLDLLGGLGARQMADRLAVRTQNIDGQFVLRRGLQDIVDHGPGGRVFAHRPAAVHRVRIVQAIGLLRGEQHDVARDRIGLAQRRDIVEDPESAAMGGHNQVIALHQEVMDRRDGQVQLQRLPGCAVVQREEDAKLSARIEQAPSHRVLAHRMHHCALRQA